MYLNEFCFRYNTRDLGTEERFNAAVSSTIGRRVTMADIRGTLEFSEFNGLCKRRQPNNFTMEEIKHLLSYGGVERIEQDGKVYTQSDLIKGLF